MAVDSNKLRQMYGLGGGNDEKSSSSSDSAPRVDSNKLRQMYGLGAPQKQQATNVRTDALRASRNAPFSPTKSTGVQDVISNVIGQKFVQPSAPFRPETQPIGSRLDDRVDQYQAEGEQYYKRANNFGEAVSGVFQASRALPLTAKQRLESITKAKKEYDAKKPVDKLKFQLGIYEKGGKGAVHLAAQIPGFAAREAVSIGLSAREASGAQPMSLGSRSKTVRYFIGDDPIESWQVRTSQSKNTLKNMGVSDQTANILAPLGVGVATLANLAVLPAGTFIGARQAVKNSLKKAIVKDIIEQAPQLEAKVIEKKLDAGVEKVMQASKENKLAATDEAIADFLPEIEQAKPKLDFSTVTPQGAVRSVDGETAQVGTQAVKTAENATQEVTGGAGKLAEQPTKQTTQELPTFKAETDSIGNKIEKNDTGDIVRITGKDGAVKYEATDLLKPAKEVVAKTPKKIPQANTETPVGKQVSDIYKNTDKGAAVSMDLENAQAGSRVFNDGEVTGIKSTFPEWLPEETRTTPIVNRVLKHLDEGTVPKESATRVHAAYKAAVEKITGKPLSEFKPKQMVSEADSLAASAPTKTADELAPKPVNPETAKVSKAASDINKSLVAKGFEALPEDEVAKFSSIKKKETLDNVANYIENDLEAAKKAAAGKIDVPNDVNSQVLFNAIAKHAEDVNDYQLLADLAKSPIARARSEAAQTLGASGFNKESNNAVDVIQRVTKAKEKAAIKKAGGEKQYKYARKNAKNALKKSMKDSNLTKEEKSWSKFLDNIKC